MKITTRVRSICLAIAVAATVHIAEGVQVVIRNHCVEQFELSHVVPGTVRSVEPFPSGAVVTKTLSNNDPGHVFKAGRTGQATLAEISTDNVMASYDIAAIATGARGPDNCSSHDDCKQYTGGVGFNFPMQIIPEGGSMGVNTCRALTCTTPTCSDAYQYPGNYEKMHTCSLTTNFQVIFCPGGPGGAISTPMPAPTSAESTPAPTTPQPKTDDDGLMMDGLEASGSGSNGNGTDSRGVEEDGTIEIASSTIAPTVVTPAPMTTQAQETNTQSSVDNSTSPVVYILSILGAVAMIAGVAIVAIRQKQRQLDGLEQKSPMEPMTTVGSKSIIMVTPKETSVL